MQRDRWAAGQLAREACRNVFDLRSRLFFLLGLAALMGALIPIYAAVQSTQLRAQLSQDALRGRNILVFAALNADSPVEISRASCERLSSSPDVVRAGVLLPLPTRNFLQLGAVIPVAAASSTLLPELARFGALVGSALRPTGPAFSLLMPDGGIQSAIVNNPQPDVIGTNSNVVVGLPPAVTSTPRCIVVLTPTAIEAEAVPQLRAQLQSTGGAVSAQQEFTESRSPIALFLGRPDQFLPLLLALAGALSAGMLNRLRTAEWAAYRMSGTSARSLAIIMLCEQSALAGCLGLAATLATLVLAPVLISPVATIGMALAAAALWVGVGTFASVQICWRKPTSLAKDR